MLPSSSVILAILATGPLCQAARLPASQVAAAASQINDSKLASSGRPPTTLLQIDTDDQSVAPREFHFGAKIAISLLLATIGIVALATLVDYQINTKRKLPGSRRREASSPNGRLLFGKRESGGLRDYRSLSMSSNCSSNLFCSTSSVASSSTTPIHNQQQAQPISGCSQSSSCNQCAPGPQADCCPYSLRPVAPSERQLFESNLQLHYNDSQPMTLKVPPPQQFANNKPGAYLSLSQSDCSSSGGGDCGASTAPSRHELVEPRRERANSSSRSQVVRVGKQILLAFSLRQSARQIFGAQQQQAGDSAAESPDRRLAGAEDGARRTTQAYVSSEECQARAEAQQAAPTTTSAQGAQECVDSLHGLRFLSMIWVIVIHSYNFALRWMFFSNATTLDGIYKSAASQLIANGSFACDSFFFAGGFLLPYLAFASDDNSPAADTNRCQQQRHAQQVAPSTRNEQQRATSASAHSDETTLSKLTGEDKSTCGGGVQLNCCSAARLAALVEASARTRARPISARPHHEQVTSTAQSTNQVSISVAGPQQALAACCQQRERRPCSAHQCEQEQNTNELGGASQRSGPSAREFTLGRIMANILHRYIRMMPLMMAIIGLCSTLLRYLGEGPVWEDSTLMYDGWCRKNWWINAMFLHNFVGRENMCLSHSWYSAVDLQLFLVGQLVLFALARSRKLGLGLLLGLIAGSQLITVTLTLAQHLPAVPLVSSVDEQTMNLYYGQIYIKPYCRGSPYFIGILLAYLMRTTKLGQLKLKKWQALLGWSLALSTFAAIILAMQPAMNGRAPSELESALYSALSRPLWALATGWMIFACITKQGGFIGRLLGAKCFIPLSRLTYPAFLIHPIVMALFYGSRQASFHFSHYLMLYLILGNIVITYASAFILAALFELPLISIERTLSKLLIGKRR